ncbi:hypothetical protein EHV15_35835 [Paenibacillus oralis]|uniref:Uncharacterized protein n=1 Tax=Paenibacillus oralis TaxID=2490856 RepID=A0A3P3TBP2_9BACL|nr:hypothetical protein [Paenibacillus oralis]RRJ54944.1 hypothetical protein EHV15_35835 [Paenibacillus oralis]
MYRHASALWETYTDTEKVSWICETVMKMEVVSEHEDLRRCRTGNMGPWFAIYGGQIIFRSPEGTSRSWDPLNNASDAIEAEKIFTNSNEEVQEKYTTALTMLLQIEDWKLTPTAILKLTQAPGGIRAEAMFMAVNQTYES